MRIASFLPAATEIVCALGLEQQLVGVTHECDYPPSVRSKPVVLRGLVESGDRASGDIDAEVARRYKEGHRLYEVDAEALRRADPDLLLAQRLCPVCAAAGHEVKEALKVLGRTVNVVNLEPHLLYDVLVDIARVGEVTGAREPAKRLVGDLRRRVEKVAAGARAAERRPRVLCLEWLDPPYVAGHWVPDMVRLAGGEDVLGKPGEPSFRVDWEVAAGTNPDVIVLMPCGYGVERGLEEWPVALRQTDWSRVPAVKAGRVYALDASARFSRPGPRLVEGLETLAELLHTEEFAGLAPPDSYARVEVAGPQ